MVVRAKALIGFVLTIISLLAIYYRQSTTPQSIESPYRLFNSTRPLPSTEYAIATFLTGQARDDDYFIATRVLTYQLLHDAATRYDPSSITFLVLCSESVDLGKKETLRADGATVVDVKDVPVNWWIHSGVQRWKEQFTKLRVFEMTDYKRILFIDADTILLKPLDGIFHEPEVSTAAPMLSSRENQIRSDEAPLPAQWLFAARSDNQFTGEREHPVPPLQALSFSAGFFLVSPDRQLFKHLLSVMSHFRRFDPFTMEQSLLNYVFRREGAMPWREMHWKWSATWPNEKDAEMGVASLHEKFWKTGPQVLRDKWALKKAEMLEHYENRTIISLV